MLIAGERLRQTRHVAERMTDPEAKRVMLFVAEAYERLALHAEARKSQSQ